MYAAVEHDVVNTYYYTLDMHTACHQSAQLRVSEACLELEIVCHIQYFHDGSSPNVVVVDYSLQIHNSASISSRYHDKLSNSVPHSQRNVYV